MPESVSGGRIDVDAVRHAYHAVRSELELSPAEASEAVGGWFGLTGGEVLVLLGVRPVPGSRVDAVGPSRPVPVGGSAPDLFDSDRTGLRATIERLVRQGTYLLTAFPLGLIYLVGSLVGLGLGAGLLVVLVGLVVLAAVAAAWSVCLDLERELAGRLLGVRFEQRAPPVEHAGVRLRLRSRLTVRGVAFLVLKFPLGVATLAVMAAAGGLSVAPFAAAAALLIDGGGTAVVTVPLGLVAVAVGVGTLFVLVAVVDALARVWAGLAVALLSTAPRAALR